MNNANIKKKHIQLDVWKITKLQWVATSDATSEATLEALPVFAMTWIN